MTATVRPSDQPNKAGYKPPPAPGGDSTSTAGTNANEAYRQRMARVDAAIAASNARREQLAKKRADKEAAEKKAAEEKAKAAKTGKLSATLYIIGFMVCGSGNTIFTKMQFSLSSVGVDGQAHPFHKPYFGSFRMFIAMSMVLLGYCLVNGFFAVRQYWRERQAAASGKSKGPLTDDSLATQSPALLATLPSPRLQADAQSPRTAQVEELALKEGEGRAEKEKEDDVFLLTRDLDFRTFLFVAVPSFFDLVASTLGFVGIIYVDASVWQMLRGSVIVFSSAFSILFLNRRMFAYNWFGVFSCMVGICLVGASNLLSQGWLKEQAAKQTGADGAAPSQTEGAVASQQQTAVSSAQQIYGMGIVVAAQVVQASRVVLEEKIMKGLKGNGEQAKETKKLPPAILCGLEGVWGCAILLVLVFPALYFLPGSDSPNDTEGAFIALRNGGKDPRSPEEMANSLSKKNAYPCQENFWDSVLMLMNSPPILLAFTASLCTVSTYNFCGMSITRYLNAVHRTMCDAWRTMAIWGCGLWFTYSYMPEQGSQVSAQQADFAASFGEHWTPYSWLQLGGFLCIVFGQTVYGGLLKLRFLFSYEPEKVKEPTFEDMASPASHVSMELITPLPSAMDDPRERGEDEKAPGHHTGNGRRLDGDKGDLYLRMEDEDGNSDSV